MDPVKFTRRHPRLWHLAHGDAWPGIAQHGLLSAQALVRVCGLPQHGAENLLSHRRLDAVPLTLPGGASVVLRDQRPLHEGKLQSALTDGMTVAEWLRLLNGLVFFFPTEEALLRFHRVYATEPAIVLELDSRRLLKDYGSLLRLAHINTGAVLYSPATRGRSTFTSVDRFDPRKQVKEVAVRDALPDVVDYLVTAERWLADGTRERFPHLRGTRDDVHPRRPVDVYCGPLDEDGHRAEGRVAGASRPPP